MLIPKYFMLYKVKALHKSVPLALQFPQIYIWAKLTKLPLEKCHSYDLRRRKYTLAWECGCLKGQMQRFLVQKESWFNHIYTVSEMPKELFGRNAHKVNKIAFCYKLTPKFEEN